MDVKQQYNNNNFDIIVHGDFIQCNKLHQFVFIIAVFLSSYFSCTSAVKTAAVGSNNYS